MSFGAALILAVCTSSGAFESYPPDPDGLCVDRMKACRDEGDLGPLQCADDELNYRKDCERVLREV